MNMLSGMTSTEIAAWWGAILATLILFWDVYKWKRQGPKLVMRLSPNIHVFGDPLRENNLWVSITVTNIGDRPTTIKGVGMEFYTSWLQRLINRTKTAAIFTYPNYDKPLPQVLNSGDEWYGLIPQKGIASNEWDSLHRKKRLDEEFNIEELSRTGHLMIWLTRSDHPQALRTRLAIPKKTTKNYDTSSRNTTVKR